jgi:hypothetical protein
VIIGVRGNCHQNIKKLTKSIWLMKNKRINCETARGFSITKALEKLGQFPCRESEKEAWFLSPFRSESQASFKVSKTKNRWYDHGIGEGGNVIDLVCRIQNCSVKEALDYLAQQESSFSFQQQELFEGEESQRIVIRIVRNITYPALEQYLRSRGIPIVTAKTFCKEVHYQCRGKRYFALGLVNKSGGWELRNKYFKGSTTPKDLSLFTHGHPSLAVVEGMFDLLSLVVIFPTIQATHDLLVLNSISLADKAAPVLGNYNTIDLYLDNDSGGKTLSEKLVKEYPNSIDHSDEYKGFKDLNEWLLKGTFIPV